MASIARTQRRARAPLPKYQRVREWLRKQIQAGLYPQGGRLPPETKLPKLLRVNRLTAVRALNDLVREGLLVRRRGSGTFVTFRGRPPLLPGRNLRLGLLWPLSVLPQYFTSNFQMDMTRGALAEWGLEGEEPNFVRPQGREATRAVWTSADRGLTVVALGEGVNTRPRHPPLDAVREERFDGVLTFGIIETEWLRRLQGLGLPVVVVDFPGESSLVRVDAVFADPLGGYRKALGHLASQGLRRIHFVGARMQVPAPVEEMTDAEWRAYKSGRWRIEPDSYPRLSAYRQAMDECGLPVREEWIHCEFSEPQACRELAERLAALPDADRPEAVVCHDAGQAEVLISVFAERGLALSGVGAGSSPYSGRALAVHVKGQALGAAAAALLVSRLQCPGRPYFNVGVKMVFQPSGEAPSSSSWEARGQVKARA